jgi:hypothetical protein
VAMRFLIAWVASMAIAAHAGPIIFSTTSYQTTALALADGPAGFNTQTGPPVPISSSAISGVNDFASASAFANVGQFTASSEADGFTGSPSAVGETDFVGTILDYGKLNLVLNYNILNFGGTGDLFVLLTNSISGQLVNDDLTAGGIQTYQLTIPKGGVTTLDISVVSQAFASPGISASNFSQATISGSSTIPLPATPFLVVAGFGAMLTARRKRQNDAAT